MNGLDMSRRIEKLSRTIRDVVSDVIQNQLSDPRIRGMVSITRVELASDLSLAKIYLSVIGVDSKHQELSCKAVISAGGFIRTRLASVLTTRTCPSLEFHLDDSLKKGFGITQLLDKLAAERDDQLLSDNDNQHNGIIEGQA